VTLWWHCDRPVTSLIENREQMATYAARHVVVVVVVVVVGCQIGFLIGT
jgi:hypothetical protein